jgi:hypothetical protein
MSHEVHGLMTSWKDLGIPYFVHVDESMDSLVLSNASKSFPQLQLVWKHCLRVKAAKADLWRNICNMWRDMDISGFHLLALY